MMRTVVFTFAVAPLLLLVARVHGQQTAVLTRDQVNAFLRDGYLYIPRFFETDESDFVNLIKAGEAKVEKSVNPNHKIFSVMETGSIFGGHDTCSAVVNEGSSGSTEPSNCMDDTDDDDFSQAFRDIALRSKLVQASAELMQLDAKTQNMRILRDVFLAKPVGSDQVCDWHVDDQSFWPESFLSGLPALEDGRFRSSGINVWIALDDMLYGGSMVVSPGSHTAPWRFDGYRAIGQLRTKEPNTTKEEIRRLFSPIGPPTNSTCNMPEADKELRDKIEATKRGFDIRKGDVIIADRLLFHRTITVSDEGQKYFEELSKQFLCRYSIRYVPGTARLPVGFNSEVSLLLDPAMNGMTLNEVVNQRDMFWYPQVWPELDPDVDTKLVEMGPASLEGKNLHVELYKELTSPPPPAKGETTTD